MVSLPGSAGPGGSARRLRVPRPFLAALPVAAAAVVPLAFWAAGFASGHVSLALAAGFVMLGVLRGSLASRDRRSLRRTADELVRTGVKVHPQSALLVWRAAELTSNRNRRVLARSLRNIVRELERPSPVSAVPLNHRGVRPHVALIRVLAARLAQLDRRVAPQGMAFVEELLTDSSSSPLYTGGNANELPAAIERCLSALDGTSAADRTGWTPDRAQDDRRGHSGGSR